MPDSINAISIIKKTLRQALPGHKPSFITEALAVSCGYRTYAAMLSDAKRSNCRTHPAIDSDLEAFQSRLQELSGKADTITHKVRESLVSLEEQVLLPVNLAAAKLSRRDVLTGAAATGLVLSLPLLPTMTSLEKLKSLSLRDISLLLASGNPYTFNPRRHTDARVISAYLRPLFDRGWKSTTEIEATLDFRKALADADSRTLSTGARSYIRQNLSYLTADYKGSRQAVSHAALRQAALIEASAIWMLTQVATAGKAIVPLIDAFLSTDDSSWGKKSEMRKSLKETSSANSEAIYAIWSDRVQASRDVNDIILPSWIFRPGSVTSSHR